MDRLLKALVGRVATPRAARALEAWCFVFLGLIVVGVVAGGLLLFGRVNSAAVLIGIEAAAIILGASLMALLSRLAELFGQHARDIDAQALLAALRRGEGRPPFTLYLRPFASTGEIDEEELAPLLVGGRTPGLGMISARYELEHQIERATRKVGPLVALGLPLEHIGAGRIAVDETNWKEAVELLTRAAALIIMLPSSRAGTQWEISHILDGDMMQRTVIIDPPNMPPRPGRRFNQAAEWGRVREVFAQHGYDMPADSKIGRMLFFGAGRAPEATTRLDIEAEGGIARFFRTVIRAQGAKTQHNMGTTP
ncbi:MAG: hypothetical protein QM773_08905 [Hyphomonadaceae bacterium]